jgi:hypothetical protein
MGMVAIKKVTLKKHHLSPGRTKHTLSDSKGVRPFPPFTSLAITRYGEESGYYLMHICDNNLGTDTWHETLEDALGQAEWEFGVLRSTTRRVDGRSRALLKFKLTHYPMPGMSGTGSVSISTGGNKLCVIIESWLPKVGYSRFPSQQASKNYI